MDGEVREIAKTGVTFAQFAAGLQAQARFVAQMTQIQTTPAATDEACSILKAAAIKAFGGEPR